MLPENPAAHPLCPCESGNPFAQCCEPLILGKSQARTAEQLMRSRYTAYTRKNWDYLVKTTHASTRHASLRKELEHQHQEAPAQWCGLKIVSTSAGQVADKMGKVRFEASYFFDGELMVMREHSRFKRGEGVWKYLDDKG